MKKALEYQNYIFDFDSTLVTIEGIDELGELKNIRREIEKLTELAMSGKQSMDDIFQYRLKLIKPTLNDLQIVADKYLYSITDGANETINHIKENGGEVFVVTGGYTESVFPTTDVLGIKRSHVFANELLFSSEGEFVGLNESIPLWKNHGKAEIVREICRKFPGKTVCIGDGMSDYEASLAADGFICFAGIVQRPDVMKLAERVVVEQNLHLLSKV